MVILKKKTKLFEKEIDFNSKIPEISGYVTFKFACVFSDKSVKDRKKETPETLYYMSIDLTVNRER